MRLEPFCVMELGYEGAFGMVKPYGGEEGSGYGAGDGSVTGGLNGKVRWSNHPHRRSDGRMLPDAAGEITTEDGAKVIFRLQGRTVFREVNGQRKGGQLLWLLFESDADAHRALNDDLHVVEGVIDSATMRIKFSVFRCVHEGL